MGPRRYLPGQHRPPRRRPGVRVLRRAAVRQRAAALRAPADRLRQRHRAPVSHDARIQGRAPLRLGHPRAARGTGSRTAVGHHGQIPDRRHGHRRVQRRLPGLGVALHRRMAGVRDAPGALGRFRQRLQDARSAVHGVGDLGVQATVGQGPGLRGLPRAALLLARRNPAVQPRTAHGRRRLPEPPGPGGDGGLQGGGGPAGRRAPTGVDHDTVDPAVEPGGRGQPGRDLRRGRGRRASFRAGGAAAGGPCARTGGKARDPGHLPRGRPAGHAVPAAVPVLHGERQRFSGTAGRLRDHRGRHRDRPHGARLRRGRHGDHRQGRHRPGHPRRRQGAFRRHGPGLPGAAGVRRQSAHHPRPEER